MIGKLTGILAERNPPQVVVDCNGVGYEVDVPMSTFYNLPNVGTKVSLLTHFVVRGWLRREPGGRALTLTPPGRIALEGLLETP